VVGKVNATSKLSHFDIKQITLNNVQETINPHTKYIKNAMLDILDLQSQSKYA